jgi:hypothetical protein
MEILNSLNGTGLYQIIVMLGIVAITEIIKQYNEVYQLIKFKGLARFFCLVGLSFIISLGLTALWFIPSFTWLIWLRASFFNWIFSYVFYDTIKNLLKNKDTAK